MSFHLLTSPAHPTCWVWSKKIAAAWDCEPDGGMITNLTQDCFQLKLSLGAGWRYRQLVSTFQKHYFQINQIRFRTISPRYFTHSDTIQWFGCWNKCRNSSFTRLQMIQTCLKCNSKHQEVLQLPPPCPPPLLHSGSAPMKRVSLDLEGVQETRASSPPWFCPSRSKASPGCVCGASPGPQQDCWGVFWLDGLFSHMMSSFRIKNRVCVCVFWNVFLHLNFLSDIFEHLNNFGWLSLWNHWG